MILGLIPGLIAIGLVGCGTVVAEPPVEVPAADVPQTTLDTAAAADVLDIPNEPPSVGFIAPTDGLLIPAGQVIGFEANVADDHDAPEQLTIGWASDQTGLFSTKPADTDGVARIETGALLGGTHVITLTVTDSEQAAASARVTVTIDVTPGAPEVTIAPLIPTTTDTLVATIIKESDDPNGQEITYGWQWLVNGEDSGVVGPTVAAAQTARGELWQVRVTASDGTLVSKAGDASVIIQNTPPVCGEAEITPAFGDLDTEFVCACTHWSDIDGDVQQDRCMFVIGVQLVSGDSCTLDSAASPLYPGAEVSCTLTPYDGEDEGTAVVAPVSTVTNGAPLPVPGVTLGPDPARVDSILSCIWGETTDPDGDPIGYVVTWFADGFANQPTSAPDVLAGSLSTAPGVGITKGATVWCRVQADDGTSLSPPVDSESIAIVNAPPSATHVLLGPLGLQEGQASECAGHGGADPDGDPVVWTMEWRVDDVVVQDQTGNFLGSEFFDKGDTLSCTGTPSDGEAAGEPIPALSTLAVFNTPPVVSSVVVDPPTATFGSNLTCTALGYADPDPADGVASVDYTWIIPDEFGGTTLEGSGGPNLFVSLAAGQKLLCRAIPYDDESEGPAVDSAVITISADNTVPTLTQVSIQPNPAVTASILSCVPGGFVDPDGQSPVYKYHWIKNNTPLGAATESTLFGVFTAGDAIRCVVTPGDGLAFGTPVTSPQLIISSGS
ncbi:MAG: hypothetical protein ACI9WU_003230 [Myxococcota bacterium]|jgi:hypothetical protein